MSDNGFFAIISRMSYITRWGLMRNAIGESVQEHSHMAAVLAHALAVVGNELFGRSYNADRAATLGLYHDASEILTGDMPTPVKYHNPEILAAYRAVERASCERLLQMLPPELRDVYRPLIFEEDEALRPIVKAADSLSAYIKCVEELKAGNTEFKQAGEQTLKKLRAMSLPELDYFIDNLLPAFSLSLDELTP